MKVQPGGLEQARLFPFETARPAAGGFRTALAQRIEEAAGRWKKLAGGDAEWSAAPVLRPPPKPPGLEAEVPETRRMALHGIAAGEGGGASMDRLREMLRARLALEDSVLARAAIKGR